MDNGPHIVLVFGTRKKVHLIVEDYHLFLPRSLHSHWCWGILAASAPPPHHKT